MKEHPSSFDKSESEESFEERMIRKCLSADEDEFWEWVWKDDEEFDLENPVEE